MLRRRNKINVCNYDQNKGNISKIIGWGKNESYDKKKPSTSP